MSVRVKKRKKPYTPWDITMAAIALFCVIIVVYPLWYVIINAISDPELVAKGEIEWFPVRPDLMAYKAIVFDIAFYRAIIVTVFFGLCQIVMSNVANLLVAYPMARRNLKGRKFVVAFFIVGMYLGGGFLPQFILINNLGLYNTPWAIILPNFCASLGLVALYQTFIRSVATDLMDAAMVDGASNLKILFRVVVPVIKPAIAVQVMQMTIGAWNSWFGVNVYLPERKWQTVQLFLSRLIDGMSIYDPEKMEQFIHLSAEEIKLLKQQYYEGSRIKFAAMLLVAVPLLLGYPFMQKNLAQGIMVGSLKE